MSKNNKQFFTLIELVVVIAILGIVAGILFPIFAQQRDHGSRGSCLSNGKQVGVGMMMYTQDYDGHLPPAAKWMTVSMPYIKMKTVFLCPIVQKAIPKAPASFAMDSRLSEAVLKKLPMPQDRALAYDSTRTDWDATDPGQTFVTRHNQDKAGTLIYADGHAKWVSAEIFAQAVNPHPDENTKDASPQRP